MKSDMPYHQFIDHIKLMHDHIMDTSYDELPIRYANTIRQPLDM